MLIIIQAKPIKNNNTICKTYNDLCSESKNSKFFFERINIKSKTYVVWGYYTVMKLSIIFHGSKSLWLSIYEAHSLPWPPNVKGSKQMQNKIHSSVPVRMKLRSSPQDKTILRTPLPAELDQSKLQIPLLLQPGNAKLTDN